MRIRELEAKTDLTAHFSVDDTIWLFENLGHFGYKTIFDQPTLSFFRELHESFGIKVSFYCFGDFQGNILAHMTTLYRREFEENSEWLRFGFHGMDDFVRYGEARHETASSDYTQVVGQLRSIVGEKSIDPFPRLHCYSGSRNCLKSMSESGLKGVLCAVDGNSNYYLNSFQNARLNRVGHWIDKKEQLVFIKTDIQVEKTKDVERTLSRFGNKRHIEAFTHEWALDHVAEEKIRLMCATLREKGYRWAFQEERGDIFG